MQFIIAGISLLLMTGINDLLIKSAIENYWIIAKMMLGLVVIVSLLKIVLSQMSFGGYADLKEILKNAVKFVLYIAIAPTIITTSMKLVDEASKTLITESKYSESQNMMGKLQAEKTLSPNKSELSDFLLPLKIYGNLGIDIFQWSVRYIVIVIAQLLEFIRDMVFAVFVAIMPILLFFGLILGMQFFSNTILTIGATLLIWPLVSAILLRFSLMVFKSESESYWTSVSQATSLLIYSVAQLLLPFLILKGGTMAASSVRSGVGNAMGSILKLRGGK